MSQEHGYDSSARREYMRTGGFVIFNDVTCNLLSDLASKPFPGAEQYSALLGATLEESEKVNTGAYRSMVELYTASQLFAKDVLSMRDPMFSLSRAKKSLDLTPAELASLKRHTFDLGIDELDYAWIFSPALAATTVHSFVRAGELPEETAKSLTLSDWAEIMSSQWFGELTHQAARTRFGVLRSFGSNIIHYGPHVFRKRLEEEAAYCGKTITSQADVLVVGRNSEPGAQGKLAGLKAKMHPAYSGLLRELRRDPDHIDPVSYVHSGISDGCPVAKRTALLPEGHRVMMPRVEHLQAMGWLSVSKTPKDGKVLVTQEKSAIEQNVAFIANQLRGLEASLPRQ